MAKEELIVKFLAGEADTHEVDLLMAWRQASEANELHFLEIEKIWLNSGSEAFHDYRADEAWIKVSERIDALKEKNVFQLKPSWLIAASLALLLTIAIWLFQGRQESHNALLAFHSDTMTTLRLEDGSQVTLLSGVLHYPKEFTKQERLLKLDSGKAFFKIARDQTKPFIIEANQTQIRVLGTGFEVNTNAQKTSVKVVEGKVKFSYQDQDLILTANQAAQFNNATKSLIQTTIQDENSLSYITGKLVFRNTLMTDVVKALNAHYKNQVVQVDAAMAACRLTATFENETLDNVLKVIEITMAAEQKKDSLSGKYTLFGKGCLP